MSKHSVAFKLSVVEFYRKGERSAREVGAHFGVDHSTVRKWVASYEAHGAGGLAKKFSHYDAAFKLSVLQRMWEDGLSYRRRRRYSTSAIRVAFRIGKNIMSGAGSTP